MVFPKFPRNVREWSHSSCADVGARRPAQHSRTSGGAHAVVRAWVGSRMAAALWPPKSCGAACMYARASLNAAMALAMRGCMARSFCANSVIPTLKTTPRTIPEMNFMAVFYPRRVKKPPQKIVRRCTARMRATAAQRRGSFNPENEAQPAQLAGKPLRRIEEDD